MTHSATFSRPGLSRGQRNRKSIFRSTNSIANNSHDSPDAAGSRWSVVVGRRRGGWGEFNGNFIRFSSEFTLLLLPNWKHSREVIIDRWRSISIYLITTGAFRRTSPRLARLIFFLRSHGEQTACGSSPPWALDHLSISPPLIASHRVSRYSPICLSNVLGEKNNCCCYGLSKQHEDGEAKERCGRIVEIIIWPHVGQLLFNLISDKELPSTLPQLQGNWSICRWEMGEVQESGGKYP